MVEALEDLARQQQVYRATIIRDLLAEGTGLQAHLARYGHPTPTDNKRSTLTPAMAATLLDAHKQTGGTYRQVAAALGLDTAMWWRMCHGTRAPSRRTATLVINGLDLPPHIASALMEEAA